MRAESRQLFIAVIFSVYTGHVPTISIPWLFIPMLMMWNKMATINATAATDEMSPVYILNVFYWEQIILAIIVGFIAIGGLIGNAMIIAAVSFSKKLQTSTNAFVTSLSVVDLLTAFTLIWYSVSVLGKGEWPIPGAHWLCQFTGFMVYASIATSMWTLGIIAINRLIYIVKSIWYKILFTSWKLGIIVVIPWVLPTASFLVLIAKGNVAFGYNKPALACAAAYIVDYDEFNLGIMIIGLLFPLPAIVISYIWIYLVIRDHFQKQKQCMQSSSVNSATSSGNSTTELVIVTEEGTSTIARNSSGNSTTELVIEHVVRNPNRAVADRRRKQISKQEIQITKNLFYVVIGFFVVFLPYVITLQFESQSNIHILFYLKICPLFNCAINFVIYALKHPDFKIVLRHI